MRGGEKDERVTRAQRGRQFADHAVKAFGRGFAMIVVMFMPDFPIGCVPASMMLHIPGGNQIMSGTA
jgi:hypothetical protein